MELSNDQKALLETQFPEELEKQAAAEAAMAFELYSVGFEKMAAEAAEKMDEEKEEEKEEEKKELSEEQEKEAQSRAAFIARGFIDGLMEKGASVHNDPYHYLVPAIAEKLAADAGKVKAFLSQMGSKAKDAAGKAGEHISKNKGAYAAGAAGAAGGAAAGYMAGKKKDKK